MSVPKLADNQESLILTEWQEQGKIETRSAAIWKRFKKNKLAVTGLIVFSCLILLAIFAPLVAPHDPYINDYEAANTAPNIKHPFGTDSLGGDVFSRAIYGTRISLTVALSAMVFTLLIGITYGAVAGYFGGVVDNVMMRVVDAIQSIPSLFLLLIIASIIPPTIWTTVFVLSIVGWTGMSRIVRGEILTLKQRDFVEAARATGEVKPSIIFYHILPNAIAPITVIATLDIAGNILAEAGLSFLGLGIQAPTPSWGNMLTQAQDLSTLLMYPWVAIFPGLFIIIAVMSVNFVGDGLRDALDPRNKN
ncbi:ABC transporter permease [Neobacillus piezotolerans]|uniref:ABC transporter permease n=1 Tax=Neobacillus piezotolerans TaxID=2259171 RepID=A0A3D8GNE7_9BACI|nr:oligopeptide ABC transporter permease [Neobacillus piezotolerans]RDU36015.1 ABC transporter permease [Neobacillus piezotolerans]